MMNQLARNRLLCDTCAVNLVPRSLFRSLHKYLETAKTIHKILLDDLIFENLQFYSIGKLNYI
jgi:hypothetical protein